MESLRASLAHPEDTDTYRLTLLFRLSASLPKSTPFSPQDCESLREAVVERVGIQFLCRVFDTASSPPASSELISSTAATVIASIASGIPPGFPFWLAPRQGESPLTHATALTVLSVRLWARALPLATGAGAGAAEADAAGAVSVCAASAVTAAAVAASLSAASGGRSTEKKRACAAAAAAASHAINTWCLISLLHPPAIAVSPSPAPAPAPISGSNSSSSGGALSAALVAAGASLLAVCGGALAAPAARDLTTAGCSPLKSVLLPEVAATTLSFTPPPLPSCSLAHVPAPIAALVRAPSLCHRLLAVALAAAPVPAPNAAATAPEGSHDASTLSVSAHIRAAARGLLCGLLYLASGLASDDLTSVPKPRALQSIPVAEGGSVPPQWALLLRLLLLPAPAPAPAPASAPTPVPAPAPVPASEPAQASTHEMSPQTTVSPLAATLPSLRPLTLAACAALLHVFGPAAFTAPASPPVVEAWKAAHSHLSSSACAPPPPPPLRSVQAALALGAVEAHLAAVSVVTSVRAAARAARRAAKALSKAANASSTPLNTSEDAPFERKARQALGDAWVAAALRGETMGSKGTAGSKGDETDDDDDDDDDGKEGAEALATTALTAAEAAAQQSLAAQEGAASLLSVASDLFSAVLDAATADDHAPPASQSLPSLKQAFAAPIDSIPPSSPQSQAAPASLSWDRAGISSSAVFAGLQSLAQPGVELLAHSHAATKTATKARLTLSGAAERARLAGVAATLPERALALARAHPLSAAPLRACLPLMESVAELVASPEALPPSARFEAAAPFAPRAAAAAAAVAQAAGIEAGEAVAEVAKGVQERRVLELLLPMLL